MESTGNNANNDNTQASGSQSDNQISSQQSNHQNQNDVKMIEESKAHDIPFDPELMDKQHEEIRKEIEENSPLISDILPLEMLEFEFADNPPFLIKIKNLKKKYPDYRKVRRDGSCFYRAFLFRFFEYLIKSKDKAMLDKFINSVKESKKYLMDAGFEEFVIEDFQETLLDHLESIKKNLLSEAVVLDTFCDKVKSDSLVMYLRFLVSGYLRTNAILYEHFLENGITMEQFCQTEVEPIDKDSDQIQITALVNHLNVPIKIIYLDGNTTREEADELFIPEDCDKKQVFITLLYRPGHYDLLYS